MTDARATRDWRRSAGCIALAVFVVVLIAGAALMMFSRFMLYDDEGYVLFSLKNFAEHGRLYRDVYTQYGPLPYVFYYGLSLAGMPLTHTAGRIVTIAAWSVAALGCGTIVWRATRSLAAVAVTCAAGFIYLWVMVSEPTHPGGIIVALTALLAAWGAGLLLRERLSAWAALTGAVVTALVLTKINVGAFAGISAAAYLALNFAHPAAQRWSPWVIALGFVAVPFALMRPLLHAPWVRTFALIYALGAAAAVGAAAVGRAPRFTTQHLIRFVLGGAILGALVVGVVLARGTSVEALWQGVVLGPLRHPVSFSLAFKWASGALAIAILSAAVCAACLAWRRSGRVLWADRIVAGGRMVATVGLGIVLWQFPRMSADNLVLAYGLSALWLFVWPLGDAAPGETLARTWPAVLLLGQFLHPFPVPGSQIAWGTFLALPVAVAGGWEAARWWARHRGARGTLALALARASCALVVAGALSMGWQLLQIGRQYFEGRTLALPGAEQIRLPDQSTARYQVLSFNAVTHADVLFSLPGMFSFNLWTGVPTPTLANVTHWFSLLSPAQQQAIIQQLETHPRAAVIVETGHVDFLRQRNLAPTGPLYDYIEREFVPVFTLDGFQFRVHRGRRIAPYFTAEAFVRDPTLSAPASGAAGPTRLVIPLALPATEAIASIEILSTHGRTAPLVLRADAVEAEVTPVTPEGRARGAAFAARLPLALPGPASVAFHFDGRAHRFDLEDTLIVLRNASGAELALVRMRP